MDEKKISLITPSKLKEIYIRLYSKDKNLLLSANKAFTKYTETYSFPSSLEYLVLKESLYIQSN